MILLNENYQRKVLDIFITCNLKQVPQIGKKLLGIRTSITSSEFLGMEKVSNLFP